MNKKSKCYTVLFAVAIMFICSKNVVAERHYVDILQSVASKKSGTVAFKETVDAFYLDAPVISTGIMIFEPPDKLTKIIKEPVYLSQQITGDTVTITKSNNEKEVIALSRHEGLQSIVETLRSFLTGDTKYIEENYVVELVEIRSTWQMYLSPKDENIGKWIKRINAEGHAGKVKKFTVVEVNGDNTTTIFYDE